MHLSAAAANVSLADNETLSFWEPHPHAAQVAMQMHNTEAHRGKKASGEAGDGFVHGAWTEARLRPCILAAADYRLQRS